MPSRSNMLGDLETSLTQVSDVENVVDIAALENISTLDTSQQRRTFLFCNNF